MRLSWRKGLSFGATSGVITTLGMMVGLNSSTHLQAAVIGGILVIAVADSLSDALGIHISEEAEGVHDHKEVWEATIVTFLTKFVIACSFIIPVLLLPLELAMIVSIAWGLLLIIILSYLIARSHKVSSVSTILEHLVIAIIVIIITRYLGIWIGATFN